MPGKKVNGRKRHSLVDTLGLLLAVVVTAARVQDRDDEAWIYMAMIRIMLGHLAWRRTFPNSLEITQDILYSRIALSANCEPQ